MYITFSQNEYSRLTNNTHALIALYVVEVHMCKPYIILDR